MSKTLTTKKSKKVTEITISSNLSLEEIKRRRAPFEKTMTEIDDALEYQHGWIKKKVQQAAKELEESGTITETDHICSYIIQRLQPKIQNGMIHLRTIYKAFETKGYEKFVQQPYSDLAKRMKKWQDDVVGETAQTIQHWTGLKPEEVIRTPIEEAITSTTRFRKNLIIGWSDEQNLFARQVLSVAVPILKDTLDILEADWKARRKKAELLSR